MNIIETAIDERKKQLMRQANASKNPLIKQIIEDEIKQLREAWEKIRDQQPKK